MPCTKVGELTHVYPNSIPESERRYDRNAFPSRNQCDDSGKLQTSVGDPPRPAVQLTAAVERKPTR
jgi:hypothetical protein